MGRERREGLLGKRNGRGKGEEDWKERVKRGWKRR